MIRFIKMDISKKIVKKVVLINVVNLILVLDNECWFLLVKII